ncbi:MAG: hypothetical protein GY822_32130 [Deltaproteobacteria bacterium]|nr:hypothetical protein [Deltaproteobacteria bacterium]
MALTFRNSKEFVAEAGQVAAWAGVAGFIAPFVATGSLALGICGAALFGGTLGAAMSREGPVLSKGLLGVIGGGLASLGFYALATRFGLGDMGALMGGALGGLGIGALLSSDEEDASEKNRTAAIGGFAGAVLGLTSVAAVANVAQYAEATGAPILLVSGVSAGLMGLWMAAGAGLRRLEQTRDEIIVRAERLMSKLNRETQDQVAQGMLAYAEIKDSLCDESLMGPTLRHDATTQVNALANAILDTAEGHLQAQNSAAGSGLDEVDAKLERLSEKLEKTEDPVSLGHLTRAVQALRAQKSALSGLSRTRERAEAAMEAQLELLRRLRLAVNRARTEDKEHVALEFEAISDQVDALSDDVEALHSAISEAETFSDRQLLAEMERAGRRALQPRPEARSQRLDEIESKSGEEERREVLEEVHATR